MRLLDLSEPPDADGRKVRFGYEEVVANSAAADLTDSEFFQGMLFTDLGDPPLPALDIDIEGASTPGIEGASTPASGRASTPASGRASTPGFTVQSLPRDTVASASGPPRSSDCSCR